MEIDQEALMAVFLSESEGNLDELEQSLLHLERSPGDGEVLGTAFRCTHMLKGNAESLGFEAIRSCAHALEGVLDAIRRGAFALTSSHVSLMLKANDALRAMLKVASEGGIPAEPEGLTDRLNDVALGEEPPVPSQPRAPAEEESRNVAYTAREGQHRTLRVDLTTLDRIMTITGELSVARATLRSAIELRVDAGRELDTIAETDRLFDELREQVMKLRLVPLGPMFRARCGPYE